MPEFRDEMGALLYFFVGISPGDEEMQFGRFRIDEFEKVGKRNETEFDGDADLVQNHEEVFSGANCPPCSLKRALRSGSVLVLGGDISSDFIESGPGGYYFEEWGEFADCGKFSGFDCSFQELNHDDLFSVPDRPEGSAEGGGRLAFAVPRVNQYKSFNLPFFSHEYPVRNVW